MVIYSWLRRPTWVIDGNFKLIHHKIKNPEGDVCLRDGREFVVTQKPYGDHLKSAIPVRQVYFPLFEKYIYLNYPKKSDCHNHRAQNSANIARKDLDSTGVGAVICARHGF